MRAQHRVAMLAFTPAIIIAAPAVAQIGVKAGLSYATLSNKHPDWDSRTGFAAGLSLDMGSGLISLQPEALYVQKGVTYSGSPSSTAPKLAYIDVPILIKVQLRTDAVQPLAYAGPSINFRLSCKFGELDCSDDVKSTDWGVVLGAGLRIGGKHKFTIDARYTWGLKDIHHPDEGVAAHTRTFLLMAGVMM